ALFASLVVGPLLVGVIGLEQPDPVSGIYDYTVGGVRVTLLLGGFMALVGAAWTWRSVTRALAQRTSLGSLPIPVIRESVGRGLFVAFEGGEGAGKSTQIRLLRAAIEREGHDAIVTREPGGSELGERLRTILLDPASEIDPRAETMLYAAARAQHVDEVLRPALEKGAVVLSDRFLDSSIVYQGIVREMGDIQVEQLNLWGTGGLVPDLVVVLDIDAEEGLRRASESPENEGSIDRLEAEGIEFHRRVNDAFRRRADLDPGRYLVIDASLPVEEIHSRVRDAVLGRLRANGDDLPDTEGAT
ncbi:MAG: dTMP kinase, partial [Nitriliruptorales bacterium]|nr:dTMP kinase [Nitriliruptorales bacterium]